MKYILIAIVSILAIANLLIFGIKSPQEATLVITNIHIFSQDLDHTKNNALAFNGPKVIFIGSDKHVYPLIGKDTKVFRPESTFHFYATAQINKDDFLKDFKIVDKIEIDRDYNAVISEQSKDDATFKIHSFIKNGIIE